MVLTMYKKEKEKKEIKFSKMPKNFAKRKKNEGLELIESMVFHMSRTLHGPAISWKFVDR